MTNKIVLRSVEEFMAGYSPAYSSIMPLFLGNSQQYAVEAGLVSFKQAQTIGDIRAKMITPKDTEIHQISSNEGGRDYKKYFFGAQYIQSDFQDSRGYEDVVAQVLDEHNKQSDELFLTGEGTGMGNTVNNGLFYSADPFYVLKGSYEVQKDTAGNHLADLYAKVISTVEEANDTEGRKLVLIYGATAVAKYNGLVAPSNTAFAKTLKDGLSENESVAKMPSSITPAGANGFLVVNLPKAKLHYTLLPEVRAQGQNDEKQYAWTNFLMGSSMLQLMAQGAVIRQPLTFQA